MARLKKVSSVPPPVVSGPTGRTSLIKILVLLTMALLAFHRETRMVLDHLVSGRNMLGVALPVAAAALLWLRRETLRDALQRGSFTGVALVGAGILWYLLATWPFDYGFLRLLALPIVVCGCIWSAVGRRALKHSLPVVMLLVLALPLGSRIYADLAFRPEQTMLRITRAALDQLPGVEVSLRSPDLFYMRQGCAGSIALGESNRGMSMLGIYSLIGVFVVFARVRAFWQLILCGLAAGPFLLLANLSRILVWGLATIYGTCPPISTTPRLLASTFSVLIAYILFALCCVVLSHLVIDAEDGPEEGDTQEAADA